MGYRTIIVELADPYTALVLVYAIALSVICSPLIDTLHVFTMDESKESVTDSEGGSMSGSTVESKERLSEFEGRSACGSTGDHNRKRGKQITGSKKVKSKKRQLEKSLDAISKNFTS